MTTEVVRVTERRRTFQWPEAQLNFWLIIMITFSSAELGIFALFMTQQTTLGVGTPWLFPFQVSSAAIALLFLIMMLVSIQQRQLTPGMVITGTFILFTLWITGLIEIGIIFYGPRNGVNTLCNRYGSSRGVSQATLAYLETQTICMDWRAAFGLQVVGVVFWLWMFIMAFQVNRDDYE